LERNWREHLQLFDISFPDSVSAATGAGGVINQPPPETASTLAALFSGMAQLFRAAANGPVSERLPSER
jgi:hypothetical protein